MPRRLTLRHHETVLHNPVISRCGLRCATDTPLTLTSITHAHPWGEQDRSRAYTCKAACYGRPSNPHIILRPIVGTFDATPSPDVNPPLTRHLSVRRGELSPSVPEIIHVSPSPSRMRIRNQASPPSPSAATSPPGRLNESDLMGSHSEGWSLPAFGRIWKKITKSSSKSDRPYVEESLLPLLLK